MIYSARIECQGDKYTPIAARRTGQLSHTGSVDKRKARAFRNCGSISEDVLQAELDLPGGTDGAGDLTGCSRPVSS
jgi:hypothetical protein